MRAARPLPMSAATVVAATMMIASTAIASPTASGAAASSINFESTFAAASALQANPSSIFSNKSVATFDLRGAPAAPNSAAMVANLNSQIVNNWNGVAAFNAHQYNTAFAVASPNTPLIRVKWWDCFGYGWTPDGLYNGRTQFVDVPIPAAAIPATGTDRELSVWSPSQDKLWEFWQMSKDASGQWSACWGGRIDNVSTSVGQYLGDFGVAASGLAMASYTVTMSEARSCVINHAVGIALIETRRGTNWWPAVRNDGWVDKPDAIPEGARLRLDPTIDVTALGLNPVAKAIARTAQVYGLIVTDTSGAVSVQGESPSMVTVATGSDPWAASLKGAADHEVMRNFPWDKLTVIEPSFGQPGSTQPAHNVQNAMGTASAIPSVAQALIGVPAQLSAAVSAPAPSPAVATSAKGASGMFNVTGQPKGWRMRTC